MASRERFDSPSCFDIAAVVTSELSTRYRRVASRRRESRKSRPSVSAVRKRSRRFHTATVIVRSDLYDLSSRPRGRESASALLLERARSSHPTTSRDWDIVAPRFFRRARSRKKIPLWKVSNLPVGNHISVLPLSQSDRAIARSTRLQPQVECLHCTFTSYVRDR